MSTESIGYIASAVVLATFMTKDMRVLRLLAIFSNIAFISYGILDSLAPVVCLHITLLPLNAFRLWELRRAFPRRCLHFRIRSIFGSAHPHGA
jgi:CRP/FNR family transcriptional regulator, cyclic AMP receptor protein